MKAPVEDKHDFSVAGIIEERARWRREYERTARIYYVLFFLLGIAAGVILMSILT